MAFNPKATIFVTWQSISRLLGGYVRIPLSKNYPRERVPLLLLGLPRSGSTWIARLLARHPDLHFHYEPLNPDFNPHIDHHFRLRDVETPAQGVDSYLRGLHEGSLMCWFSLLYQPPTRFLRAKGILVKDVHGLFSIPRLLEAGPCTVLLLVRHPAAIAESHIRRKLDVPLEFLARQVSESAYYRKLPAGDRLITALTNSEAVSNPWYRMGVYWELGYQLALQTGLTEKAQVLSYEKMCADPADCLTSILHFCKLPLHPRMFNAIAKTTNPTKETYTQRRSSDMQQIWQHRVTEGEMNVLMSGINAMSAEAFTTYYGETL